MNSVINSHAIVKLCYSLRKMPIKTWDDPVGVVHSFSSSSNLIKSPRTAELTIVMSLLGQLSHHCDESQFLLFYFNGGVPALENERYVA